MNKSYKDIKRKKNRRVKGLSAIPNFFTLLSIFAGFYSIISAINGNFLYATYSIVISAFCDAIDGKLARLTNSLSKFGVELDSLADVVAFGLAPALFAFTWQLNSLGKIGWAVSFIYLACTVIRLAKFNSMEDDNHMMFSGYPSPGAAGNIVSFYWFSISMENYNIGFNSQYQAYILAILTLLTSLSMVSTITYPSFKRVPNVFKLGQTWSAVFFSFIFCFVLIKGNFLLFGFGMFYWILLPLIIYFKTKKQL